jgi:hypothetical protein
MRLLPATLALALVAGPAVGQELGDFGHGHHQWHHWYNSAEDGGPLMRPHQPNVKCCDNDCRPTKARHHGVFWEVWVDREWVAVPEERIKRVTPKGLPIRTPNGMAHVCASRKQTWMPLIQIYCFVEPETEG